MASSAWRVELELEAERADPVGREARASLRERGLELDCEIRSVRAFLLPPELAREAVEELLPRVFVDPVLERVRLLAPGERPADGERTLVIRRAAGVSDPEGQTALRALELLGVPLPERARVESYRAFRVLGPVPPERLLEAGRRALSNPVIETVCLGDAPLALHPDPSPRPPGRHEIPIRDLDDTALAALSRDGGLALSVEEMRAIQSWYREVGQREATDIELETLAQTWSEHCKHKTLTGPVRLREYSPDGSLLRERRFGNLLGETVFAATERLSPPWCWSVFADNAGVIELTEDLGIAIKVETHNHPSALDPYGGAGTGIGGVIRDVLGTGLGARPIAGLDVFCVGPEALAREDLPPGSMHPDRILSGVVAGVRDYGNRMGIPTVCGTLLRDPGYTANPLVFAGCVGEIPRDCVAKHTSPGDVILAIGGLTGRDGIHGATFSSEALHEESESTDAAAVQIGDPITEKKVLDVLMVARDRRLYSALTDCGAGGFSSAIGEMGEDCGAEVELGHAPLKYPGLAPWEVWVSEAQERMVLSVPPQRLDELLALCATHEVGATVLGRFTADGLLRLRWHGELVGELPMDFLHRGVPQPEREAVHRHPELPPTAWPTLRDVAPLLLRILAHSSVASKEWIVRQYDHEVQGGTVLKPYQGPEGHAPGDGCIVKPRLDRPQGVALGCGIAPKIAELDPWAGAACAIDEAVRNVVAAGGDPHRLALLDNFCWGDCRKPDRLGSLVLAAEACFEAALAYGAPFISGKDSLNNEYRVGEAERAIPPTLLATALAPVHDTSRAVPSFLQEAGNLLILLGETRPEGGASVAAEVLGLPPSRPPRPDLVSAPALLDGLGAALAAGLVRSCHDLSEGGLAVAAAEMVLGSTLGVRLDLERVPCPRELPPIVRLYTETPTRFLIEISPHQRKAFAALFPTTPWSTIGEVLEARELILLQDGQELGRLPASALATANGVPA